MLLESGSLGRPLREVAVPVCIESSGHKWCRLHGEGSPVRADTVKTEIQSLHPECIG